MKKKEYNVGEEFQVGLCRLKCIEQRKNMEGKCMGCFFFTFDDCSDIRRNMIGECIPNKREDKKEVIFVLVQHLAKIIKI